MKDYSSYGYMQGPIRTMLLEDLNKMGVVANSNINKRRSKAGAATSQVADKYQGECGIYGRPLAELETRPVPGQPYIRVPRLLLRSCNFLSHHLETEGLFRKSGSVSRQKAIRISLNEGNGIDEDSNPHDVASLLKQFLRELPEPLLTYELYNSFIQSQMLEEEEDRIQAVLLLTLCLPDINRHTLQFLTRFLYTMSEKSSLNKMTTSNLAVVITPNVIRASCAGNEGNNIKLETQLMETIIENSSEIGLVPEDIAQRAQSMILELSGMWGVSEQEAAYKLPLKGKRKRSGSLSGILTSVFKHSKTATKHSVVLRPRTTLTRKSVSNQDVSVETKMANVPLHGDLSFSTPCIRTPGPASRPIMGTPLLTAQRRKALLRQTPVDPRKKPGKPSNITVNVTDCPSPVEFDPPNKRSKLEFSPQTEPVKRKNFKQRLSEGLTSRYRKSRLKRKRSRARRSSESSAVTTHVTSSVTDEITTVSDDVGGFSSDTQSIDKKKKDKAPVFCFKAKPGSFNDQQKRLTYTSGLSINNSEVVINNCNIEPHLDSPLQPELVDYSPTTYVKQLDKGCETPGISDATINKKKLFPSPRLETTLDTQTSQQSHVGKISPSVNLHKRRPSYLQSCHVDNTPENEANEVKSEVTPLPRRSPRLRRSAPVNLNNVQISDTPILRRSPRFSEFPSAKVRSVSGDSFTAARHSVSLNAINITPQTFSRTSMSKLQPFSPIRVSLNCIATSSNENSRDRLSPRTEADLRSSISSDKSGTVSQETSSRDLSHDRSETSDLAPTNLTDLFTSREITRLDMSLNVREFDRNFCQQLAQSTEQLAALQQKLDSEAVKLPSENVETAADKEVPAQSVRSFREEDSVIISRPTDKTLNETFNNTALNDESHVTYITQNMSAFLANNTCLQDPDSSRVDFPKFGSIPQLPSAIVLEGSPRPKSPSVKSKSSDVQSDLSAMSKSSDVQSDLSADTRSMLSSLEISECVTRDKRRASSTASVTSRNTGSTASVTSRNTGSTASVTSRNTGSTASVTSRNTGSTASVTSRNIGSTASVTTRNTGSTASVTSRNTGSTGSISTFLIHPSSANTSNCSETSLVTGSTSTLTSLNCEQSIKSPPKINRVVTSDLSAAELESCGRLSADSTLPRELAQLSHWIESSTRNLPETRESSCSTTFPKFFDDLQSSDTSFSSRTSSGSSDKATVESAKANTMLKNRLNSNTAPGTPLNHPDLQKTDSKRAVVVRKRESVESTENSDSDMPRLEVKTEVEIEVHDVKAQPAVPSSLNVASGKQVLQDDQISSTIPGSPIKENIPPPTTPGKPARTPKSSSEVDLNKINITPRSKVPRGFTKNLTSQWENMNRETNNKAGTRTRKTKIPLRTNSRVAPNSTSTTASSKPSSNPSQTTQPRKTKTSGGQSTESVRRAGLARATSVRTISKPARALNRTKSDNAGKNTGSGTRPAWRF